MPREFVHWLVLDQTTERLVDSPFAQLMRNQRPSLLLGAMAPDAPYYYQLGTVPAVERVAEIIHGTQSDVNNSRDTRISALKIASAVNSNRPSKPAEVAFLLGFISHLITDSIFHPMVFYFSGDYYHPDHKERLVARRRHRAFEVLLDQALVEQGLWSKERSMRRLFNQADGQLTQLWEKLDRVLPAADDTEITSQYRSPNTSPRIFWRSAFRYMAFLQSAFGSASLSWLFRNLAKFSPEELGCLAALFNRPSRRTEEQSLDFSQPIVFQNPVTGSNNSIALTELLEQASTQCLRAFSNMTLSNDGEIANLERALEEFGGVSLNYGLREVTSSDAKYFHPILGL